MVNVEYCILVEKVIQASQIQAHLFLPVPGLTISEGKKWSRNRRLLTSAFHYKILRGYVPVVNSCLEVYSSLNGQLQLKKAGQ